MQEQLVPLDVISTAMARTRWMSNFLGFVLEGPCDTAALCSAVQEVLVERPVMRSRLVETGGPLLSRMRWRPLEVPPVEVVDLTWLDDVGPDHDHVVDAIYDRSGELDLRVDPPIEIRVVHLRGGRTMLAMMGHHAVADGQAIIGFTGEVLARYHRRITGSEPPWSEAVSIHSRSVHDRADVRTAEPASRLGLARSLRRTFDTYPAGRMLRVTGTPSPEPARISTAFDTCDVETTARLRRRARSLDATMTDLLVAGALRAVVAWNDGGRDSGDVVRVALAVSLAAAIGGSGSNELSSVLVGASLDEIAEPDELVRSLAAQRTAAIGANLHLATYRLATSMERVRSVTPLRHLTRALERSVRTSRLGASLLFSNVGILWPEVVDGRPTGRSVLREAGGMRLCDVVFVSNVGVGGGLLLTAMTFDGTVRVTVAGNAARISSDELRRFASTAQSEVLALA